MRKLLSDETMKELGFYKVFPAGNGGYWWKNDSMSITFTDPPTAQEFFDHLCELYLAEGKLGAQRRMREALGLR